MLKLERRFVPKMSLCIPCNEIYFQRAAWKAICLGCYRKDKPAKKVIETSLEGVEHGQP